MAFAPGANTTTIGAAGTGRTTWSSEGLERGIDLCQVSEHDDDRGRRGWWNDMDVVV